MSELVVALDEVVMERLARVAERRGWTLSRTAAHLLEQGLNSGEGDGAMLFDASEADVLQAAIAALEGVPDDSFSLIGRIGTDPAAAPAP
jgi:hypothetical protein